MKTMILINTIEEIKIVHQTSPKNLVLDQKVDKAIDLQTREWQSLKRYTCKDYSTKND